MAESSLHDVALRTQSVGDDSPSDALATTTDNRAIGEDAVGGNITKENGIFTHDNLNSKLDDQALEDGTTRSDTDTSRANSVAGDSKSSDVKPLKKFVASKPISFAKYSVPKTVTTNAPPKPVIDKVLTPAPTNTSSTLLGRPRLVAKTTTSNQQKLSAYKPAAPDPMQVWNKNRATPQPSTKHLTDEELKQQYGIHLTSRLQSDNDGKEAKWADIDDDEDDWAPETIEWNDGTKTTVNPADAVTSKQTSIADAAPSDTSKPAIAPKPAGSQYSSTVGPNATVLKIGANVERQQAQKALAQQSRGLTEKIPASGSKATPAPAPVKSPWAKLPEIEKVSPVVINPQLSLPVPGRLPSGGSQTPVSAGAAASPAKEMSADDFNRSWRDSPSSQTKELFMPSSGRYEAVGDGKRRMSKNEQNFRAPAVLQRPSARDVRQPAEPSAAFQTHRTSIDQGRRRASSSISGGSGQFARRMSFKSAEPINLSQPDSTVQQPVPRDEPSPIVQTSNTYQARGPEPVSAGPDAVTDIDLEAQKAAQKALMREKIEKARQRKAEEEQRLEAEKQERIRLKLASLGPLPEPVKPKEEEQTAEKPTDSGSTSIPTTAVSAPVQSPPKPPQPHQSGEPQQYGMMKVHPLDSVKKFSPPAVSSIEPPKALAEVQNAPQISTVERPKLQSPAVNGARPSSESSRPVSDEISEASPKFAKSIAPLGSDARAGWGSGRNDHRSPQPGSLWGLPHNKTLGNGTFDPSFAGYSSQDLSRTSSTGQGWMNGRTPTVGQSPQLNHVNQHVPETRSHLLQSMTSPDSQPLSLNSEIDSVLPISRPAPIGRPQVSHAVQSLPAPTAPPASHNVNGLSNHNQAGGVAAWNTFGNTVRTQERAETEKFNREFNERREEERRTGIIQQAPYNFNETFKQVQLIPDQVSQRQISNIAQSTHVPSNLFGTLGSLPPAEAQARTPNGQYGQLGRGSRFFPQQVNNAFQSERRAVTYSHPEISRSPSPPPAEEYASQHPAFDGDYQHPKVQFPREKAIVRLPPAAPPAPPPAKVSTSPPPQQKAPLTWAARVSMPAPPPAPTARAVSTPLISNPSWQERFNGLLFPKPAPTKQQPAPTLASTREPLEITHEVIAAAVSLPSPEVEHFDIQDPSKSTSKDVEDEEDLFEDREAGSLPTVHLPRDAMTFQYSIPNPSRILPAPIDPNSIHMFMVSNWSERYGYAKPQYAIVKAPGSSGKGIKRDLPDRTGTNMAPRVRSSFPNTKPHLRAKPGSIKPRVTSKAH